MRKEAGFEVTDRIRVYYVAGDAAAKVLEGRARRIAGVVLADSIACGTADGYTKEWEIGGDKLTLTVAKSSES